MKHFYFACLILFATAAGCDRILGLPGRSLLEFDASFDQTRGVGLRRK
jgi:hypothetical protein